MQGTYSSEMGVTPGTCPRNFARSLAALAPPLVGRQMLVRQDEPILDGLPVEVVLNVLPQLLNIVQEGPIPPLYPVFYGIPRRVIIQLVHELVKEFLKGQNRREQIAYDHESPIYLFF